MATLQIKTPTSFRENIRTKLIEKFAKPNQIEEIFMYNLEIGVFNYSIKEATNQKIIKKWDNPAFVTIYKDRLRTIYTNLKNPEIIKNIKSEIREVIYKNLFINGSTHKNNSEIISLFKNSFKIIKK